MATPSIVSTGGTPNVAVAYQKSSGAITASLPYAPTAGNTIVMIAIGSAYGGGDTTYLGNMTLVPPSGGYPLQGPQRQVTYQLAAAFAYPVPSGATTSISLANNSDSTDWIGCYFIEVANFGGAFCQVSSPAQSGTGVSTTLAAPPVSGGLRLVGLEVDGAETFGAVSPASASLVAKLDSTNAGSSGNHNSALISVPTTYTGSTGVASGTSSSWNGNCIVLLVDIFPTGYTLPAPSTPTLKQAAAATQGIGSGTATVTFGSALTAGSTVYCLVGGGASTTCSPPSGGSTLLAQSLSATHATVGLYSVPITGSGQTTLSLTMGGSDDWLVHAIETSGVATAEFAYGAMESVSHSSLVAATQASQGNGLRYVLSVASGSPTYSGVSTGATLVATQTATDTNATTALIKLTSGFTGAVGLTLSNFANAYWAAALSLNLYGSSAATALTLTPGTLSLAEGRRGTFTLGTTAALSTSTTITLSDGGAGGTFNPASVTLSNTITTTSFTYQRFTAGSATITASGSGLTSASAAATSTLPAKWTHA